MTKFTEREYRLYLSNLIDSVFKILPLYEDENEFLDEYVESLLQFNLSNARELTEDFEVSWYIETVTTLTNLKENLKNNSDLTHKKVKREVFKLTNLINKELEELGDTNE